MNQEDIARMAREAGIVTHNGPDSHSRPIIERFAALVAANEREACAQACEAQAERFMQASPLEGNKPYAAHECAAAIRAAAPQSAGADGLHAQPLGAWAQIIGGNLVISVRVETLAHAARHSPYFFNCAEQGTEVTITDEAAFAKSVAGSLNREGEDGSTPITRMLDKAFEWACEQGEDGIEVSYPRRTR